MTATSIKTTVVYNPADIDSVIAAAIFASHEKCLTASTTNSVHSTTPQMVWMGAEPHAGFHADANNIVFLTKHKEDESCNVYIYPSVCDLSEEERVMEDHIHPCQRTLIATVCDYLKVQNPVMWKLQLAVYDYTNCKKTMDLVSQAYVFNSYKRALISLETTTTHSLSIENSVDDYLKHLSLLKTKLSNIDFVRLGAAKIAVINTPMEDAPWVTKLIANVYNNVVLYEHRLDRTIFSTFSREGDLTGAAGILFKEQTNRPMFRSNELA